MSERPGPIVRLSAAFARFVALESASTILLLLATVVALALANSPLHDAYEHLLHLPLSLGIGSFELELSLQHFVNDVLMAIFFFVVGMEIKRELVLGELSSPSRAALPVFGALGGMLVPAAIYAALHMGGPAAGGWGIPMATDIAFAVAALGVFGSRVSPGLKIFLLALAIVDDIGAVLVIAVFYAKELAPMWGGVALLGLAASVLLGRAGVRSYGVYVLVGVLVWYATFRFGVHATIAGVTLGLLTPARPDPGHDHAPVDDLMHRLHPWVAFAIMPIFALCNAGVRLDATSLGDPLAQRVALGVALGLLIGKPVGVTLLAWLAVRSGVAQLPRGATWAQVTGVGLLAGIGFTMALFIAALAFEGSPVLVAGAKIGILVASILATGLGLALLGRVLPARS
jgi:NhaA family Na+:H+ antiporter